MKNKPLISVIIFFTLVSFVCINSCAVTGRKISKTNIPNIEKGVTTQSQILEWFGKPKNKQVDTVQGSYNGKPVERWTYTHGFAAGFIVYHTEGEALVIDFDDKGIVLDYGYSEF